MAEININELKPNSNKYHQEQMTKGVSKETEPTERKKLERVTTGKVEKKKKSLGRRLFDIFIDENVGDVKTYLIYDVMVPAIKENIADLINSAVGMLFFGEAARRTIRKASNGTGSKVNYGGYFNGGQKTERLPRSRAMHDFSEIRFDSRGDAEQVLDNMLEILANYKQVTVADFYDLAGVTTEFTDNKYGWTDLRIARVRGGGSGGYYVELPKCVVLD